MSAPQAAHCTWLHITEVSLVWTAVGVTPQLRVEVENYTNACISHPRQKQQALLALDKRGPSHVEVGGGMSTASVVDCIRCELGTVQQLHTAFITRLSCKKAIFYVSSVVMRHRHSTWRAGQGILESMPCFAGHWRLHMETVGGGCLVFFWHCGMRLLSPPGTALSVLWRPWSLLCPQSAVPF